MTATVWGDGTPNEAFEIAPADIISEQSGNYTILEADAHKVIDYIGTGGHTFTLPASLDVGNGFSFTVRNNGSGNVTVAPVGADTVNGGASLVLPLTSVAVFLVKATDFGVIYGQSIAIAASAVSNTPAGGIAATTVQAAINELDAEKAAVAGNAANVFKVATAVSAEDAIPLAQAQASFPSATGLISQLHTAFTTTGTSTAFVLTPTQVQTAYAAGMRFRVKFHLTAGAAPTINVSGLGAKALKVYSDVGTKLAPQTSNGLFAGLLADIEYDGTDFVVLDAPPFTFVDQQQFTASGTWLKPANLKNTSEIIVEMWGAGGGGGGGQGPGGYGGAGGGAGSYAKYRFTAAQLDGNKPVTVGTGGIGGIGLTGGTGTATTFEGYSIAGGTGGDAGGTTPAGGVTGAITPTGTGSNGVAGGAGGAGGSSIAGNRLATAAGGSGATNNAAQVGGGGGGGAAGGGAGGAGGVDGGNGGVGAVKGGGGGGGGATAGQGGAGGRGEVYITTYI